MKVITIILLPVLFLTACYSQSPKIKRKRLLKKVIKYIEINNLLDDYDFKQMYNISIEKLNNL